MTLRLYNTLTRSVVPFEPLAPPRVTMYVCGPTVYDVPHIGHARAAYVFDVLRRHLSRTYQVRCVRNVTDVDDKIIDRARQEPGSGDLKAKCQAVAQRYLTAYHAAMDRLGISRPDAEPKATAHVVPDERNVAATGRIDASMTGWISQLLTAGVAYPAGGSVYFSVRKSAGYGRLSNRTPDELQAGARVEPGEHKQDPLDFALWKAAKPGEPSWSSPWGEGRPGWHIECTVMSTAYLGDAFDIHGGGVDLVFPHHENELAQAQGVGKPFATWWVHNGLVTARGEKMSKSLGNYVTLEQVLDTYPHADYLKLLFLKTHYRSPLDYSAQRMGEAQKNWQEFSSFFQHADQLRVLPSGGVSTDATARARAEFQAAMDDDLNTPRAVAALFELVNHGHRVLASADAGRPLLACGIYEALVECGMTLGLFLQGVAEESPAFHERIQAKIVERDAARKVKNFEEADRIREELKHAGVLLADTAGGTLWRRAR